MQWSEGSGGQKYEQEIIGEAVTIVRREVMKMGRECVKKFISFHWRSSASVICKLLCMSHYLLQNNLFSFIVMSILRPVQY